MSLNNHDLIRASHPKQKAGHITAATQLQIAEQWLREAAALLTATKSDNSLRNNLARVADDCAAIAKREDAQP